MEFEDKKPIKRKVISDKREKFIELAEKRVNNLLLSIRLVKNLSNKNNYIYTDAQVAKITRAIDDAVRDLKNEFKSGGNSREDFKL